MSDQSMHLSLPYIQGGQAQKHVTHNEALRALDAIVHLSVIARAAAPNPVIEEGNRYIITGTPSGDWAGHAGQIAHREQGAWQFIAPQKGWIAWDETAQAQVVFDGTDWSELAAGGGGSASSSPTFGVNATADSTNRLSVSSDAVLFSHVGQGHQVKINKNSEADTASVLFQTNWSGRAEFGLAGNDDFEVKVSPDGANFTTALRVDRTTGAVTFPQTEFADAAFGPGPLANVDYTISRAGGLIANGTGYLGNAYNLPAGFSFDASQTPNLSGAFAFQGYFAGPAEFGEFIAVDPNRAYTLTSYLRQESVAGDWSGFAHGERHAQFLGLRCYDVDGLPINSSHHGRHFHNGTDSLTTLAQPLQPGDMIIHLEDAAGWNETASSDQRRGIVIFGYTSVTGQTYTDYSRIEESDLFELGDVNKGANTVTLNKPLPAHLGNPNDPSGIWPAGTRIANRSAGFHDKFAFFEDTILPSTDQWHRARGSIGGVDRSGKNIATNFAPGTAFVRPVAMPNFSNQSGGTAGFPDTGSNHRVWFAGLAMDPDTTATVEQDFDGSCQIYKLHGDSQSGQVSFAVAQPSLVPLS